jgi:uncharacterized protein YkwD
VTPVSIRHRPSAQTRHETIEFQNMSSNNTAFRVGSLLAILFAAVSLTACGGGEGVDAGTPAPPPSSPVPPPVGPTRADFALAASTPTPNYAASSSELTAFNLTNTARAGAGVGLVAQNTKLDTAAAAHVNYLALNGIAGGLHSETAGMPGFTGASEIDRDQAVGYGTNVTEVANVTSSTNPTDCVNELLDTVYHMNAMLESWRDAGIAYGTLPTVGNYTVCVMEFGTQATAFAQFADAGTVAAYPFAGQTDVADSFMPSVEDPNPAPDLGSSQVGFPVRVSMVDYGSETAPSRTFTVTQFSLVDSHGTAIPARLIASASTIGSGVTLTVDPQGFLQGGEVFLLPLSPLASGTNYTATFAGTGGTNAYAKTWSFTTL